uniref:Integrase zinc-binding domain-containing protein n=1 Tax=Tanacetum cinerariifolium TaxID=118510 RepID=A0A6L2MIQ6_TANCI|nr:hypothetical protein [Tanacetum cinerariifolium]
MKIIPDDEIAIDAIPLATKPLIIVDWKIIKERRISSYHLIRADGSSKRYSSMIKMLQHIDREYLEPPWKLVKAKYGNTRQEKGYERVLYGNLKVMFEPDIEKGTNNMLLKVDKFVIPIDFVILYMPEDSRVPIILGRPFLATARAMIDVFNKKITLRVGDDEVIFDMDQSIKRSPTEDDECYGVVDLEDAINAEAQELLANGTSDSILLKWLEKSIDQSNLESCESFECKVVDNFDSGEPIQRMESVNTPYLVAQKITKPNKVESEQLYSASVNKIDEKKPKLKNFPQYLEYACLHGDKYFLIIISSKLSEKEKMLVLQVLEKRKGAIAWKMSDIEGISLSYCAHKILMKDDYKPVIQPQMRLNPKVQDMVKNKIVKLLDSGLIYLISYSSWVSPIHVVPKKRGMTTQEPRLGNIYGRGNTDKFPEEHLMILKTKLNKDEPWYADYVNYIVGKIVPPNWTSEKRRFFSQEKIYFWDEPHTFKLFSDNVMRQCVVGDEIHEILSHCHSGRTGGHHSASITRRKVYELGFFRPSIFKYAKDYVMRCDACQRSRNISSRSEIPQNNIQTSRKTKVTNRPIEVILESSVGYNPKNWSEKLNDALWAFKTAYKTPTGFTPSRLVYGKACHFPVEIKHKAY